MKKSFTIALFVTLAAFEAFAVTEENIHEARTAKAGGKLVVDVDFGSVEITPGQGDKVLVDAHREVKMSSKEKEQEFLAGAPVIITNEGDTVAVRAIRRKDLGRNFWHLLGSNHNQAQYRIKVPANFNLDLKTAGGDVSAKGVTGKVKADTSGGGLTFIKIQGDLHAETSGGNVGASDCDGLTELNTSGGHIEVAGGRGNLSAETGGGTVTVRNRLGDTRAETNGGRLRFANVTGKLHARTSGGSVSAILSNPLAGDVSLETSGGSISVLTPPNAALSIDASTSVGGVRTDLPVARSSGSEDSLKGTVNGGGTKLFLRSSAGSIDIASADKATVQQ